MVESLQPSVMTPEQAPHLMHGEQLQAQQIAERLSETPFLAHDVTLETAPGTTDMSLFEEDVKPEQTRVDHLSLLPHEGFESDAHHEELIHQIDAIGMPVDNYRRLAYKQNRRGHEDEFALGSWGIGSANYGTFSVYELLNKMPEQRLGTIAHEAAHANTPLRVENAHLFGGEAERQEAALFAVDLAMQTRLTGKHLNGYHAYLHDQYKDNKIDFATFAEETNAIASELALTNRAKLEQVEAAQHAELSRLWRLGRVSEAVQPVNLLSHVGTSGNVVVEGIDKSLIALVDGVSNHAELLNHVGGLKSKFYGEETQAVADGRWQKQVAAWNATVFNAQRAAQDQIDYHRFLAGQDKAND